VTGDVLLLTIEEYERISIIYNTGSLG
jgi:hypothetical protein